MGMRHPDDATIPRSHEIDQSVAIFVKRAARQDPRIKPSTYILLKAVYAEVTMKSRSGVPSLELL